MRLAPSLDIKSQTSGLPEPMEPKIDIFRRSFFLTGCEKKSQFQFQFLSSFHLRWIHFEMILEVLILASIVQLINGVPVEGKVSIGLDPLLQNHLQWNIHMGIKLLVTSISLPIESMKLETLNFIGTIKGPLLLRIRLR